MISLLNKILRRCGINSRNILDQIYRHVDRKYLYATRNIRLIPSAEYRQSGNSSYAEWAYVIGVVQTLMNLHLKEKEDNSLLDVGCGSGLLAVAGEPFLGTEGRYVGVDVKQQNVDFCREHFPKNQFEFIFSEDSNAAYSPHQLQQPKGWELASESFDMVTALSVWTHLNEEDASFYLKEVSRVLKPDGRAIITCFLLDDVYEQSLEGRSHQLGRFHSSPQDRWIFDQPSYGSQFWFHPEWADVPENAIGFQPDGLEKLLSHSGLTIVEHHPGSWKEVPGILFQDVLILKKA